MSSLPGYDAWKTRDLDVAPEVECRGTASDDCPACDGAGFLDPDPGFDEIKRCKRCDGEGRVNFRECEAEALEGHPCDECGHVNEAPRREDYE